MLQTGSAPCSSGAAHPEIRHSASLRGSHWSGETSVCPLVFWEGWWRLACADWGFPLLHTCHWAWAGDFLPCCLLNAVLLCKEELGFGLDFFPPFFLLLSRSKICRLGHLSIPSYVVLFILNCNEGQTEEGIRSDRRFSLHFWGDVCCPREALWFGWLSLSLDARDA